MTEKTRKLTTKQKFFIAEYQKDWNARQAAIRAGFSFKTAKEKGYELIHKNSLVMEALDQAISDNLMKIGVRAERALTEIARVAFSDLRKLYNEDGSLMLPHEWPEEAAGAVAGIEVSEEFKGKGMDRKLVGYTKKVRTYDKVRALELLSKHLGIIGNGKHHDEDGDETGETGRVLTTLELSAKIVYLVKLAAERKKEAEQAQIEGKGCNPQL